MRVGRVEVGADERRMGLYSRITGNMFAESLSSPITDQSETIVHTSAEAK